MTTVGTETQRARIVAGMNASLARLARSRDWMTLEQRFQTAELLRDVADVLDRGRVYRPHPAPPHPLLRRLRRTGKRDFEGRPTFVIV